MIKSGIYQITNKINGKKYIGSSKDIYKRWYQHKYELNKNKHGNKHLQNAWNKYGQDSFEFEIIEECEPEKRLYLEQFYIDKYKVCKDGYNIATITIQLYNELDYEKEKEFSVYSNLILSTKIYFEDKATIKRAKNYKFKETENVWYCDIIYFSNVIKYDCIHVLNSTIKDTITFELIYLNDDIRSVFVYNIKDRTIYFSSVLSYNTDDYFYKTLRYKDYYASDFLLGKLFVIKSEDSKIIIAYSELANDYFDKFTNEGFYAINIVYEKMFLKDYPKFLKEIDKYLKNNNKQWGYIQSPTNTKGIENLWFKEVV